MKKFLLFLLFIAVNHASAQILVTGKAIDAVSKQPLAGINVYINNTTIGTLSDSLGMFKLTVPNSAKIELVISHVAFQKQILVVAAEKAQDLLVEMVAQQNTLNEVVIKFKKANKSKIKNWVELFANNLIGNYEGISSQCRIKNPDVLYFDYNDRTTQLEVFAQEPILIENNALGYLIKLDLDEFLYNFRTDVVTYKYSVFFENLVVPEKKMAQFLKKRKTIYAGSNMHFMRSLFANNFTAEGFSVYKYRAVENKERERVNGIIQEKKAEAYALQTNPGTDISSFFSSKDTVSYYRSVMLQDRLILSDTVKLAASAIVKPNKDWSMVNFNSRDTLMVNYKGQDPNKVKGPNFSSDFNSLKNSSNKQTEKESGPLVHWYTTFMYFFNKEGINIKPDGYYPEIGLFIYGDMAERRLAGLLPFDYDPKSSL